MATRIETPRLVLRAWTPADLMDFAALNADPMVMRHFPSTMTKDESGALMAAHQSHIEQFGYGAYAVVRRDDGAFIGACGCKRITWPNELPTQVEIGWRFTAASWGQGFATEAAQAALDDCFAKSDLQLMSSFTVPANRPSWSVMERLKMVRRPDLDFDHPRVPDGHPLKRHIVYLARRAS
jgi:RimJ/RimL family protein N-acetyltransferase